MLGEIDYCGTQWRKLCAALGMDSDRAHYADVLARLGYYERPGWLRVDVAPDVDADAIAAQISAAQLGRELGL